MKNKKRIKFGILIATIIAIAIIGTIGVKKMNEPTEKEKQIAFLKEHEEEMTEYIKSQEFYITSENKKVQPEVKKVSFDYENYSTYQRDAGGIPYEVYAIDITGLYNDTEIFELLIDVDSLKKPTKILNFERY
ncbi:hypothetical protein CUM54_06040 [Enterococcus faecalis]|uniref:DUF1310 family protein n=1 Tax=Enterococcus faecalis TaxID=1351 RepID=A0A4U3KXR0_ENTFL|nr:hypothetical protein [Enterococcus faecalis]EEU76542.1 predicted protein [Enterococcus faecalis E1Sol]EGO8664212.1 hypothetical protein [Enterococcus faecalis]EGS8048646.1 hypothetical protein [Enterococcus faecalis]EHD3773000.1 hypothetical protein [Enterococcus faecalis]EIM5408136.1 hypothetical protein [Enterococcus faecalis]